MLYFTENLIAKSRKIDTEVAESSTMFASITQSDDEGDSSFEFVKNESMSDEPYTSQLRTPPKLNDTLDDSVDEYLGVSSSRIIQDGRHDSREVLFGDHEDEDNEDGSGGGSSAASTAADIMREMLEEFPRSNDTLGRQKSLLCQCKFFILMAHLEFILGSYSSIT